MPDSFEVQAWAPRVLDWFDQHGRHNLPWQSPRTSYRVWVSEIMLQQTTVAAVIGYFQRFMQRLPSVADLASADADTVMALWSGLGYYARARNLHAAAKLVVSKHGGELPADLDALQALPGIGRSTAGAILAQAFAQPAPILDGNVKRVLARHAGVAGWPGQARVQNALWQHAEARLPPEHAAEYAQAMMDLGATVCLRRRPLCGQCPVATDCEALTHQLIDQIPASKPKKDRPVRHQQFLIQRDAHGRLLLQRRPPSGIWGGLWCLPEVEAFLPAETEVIPIGLPIRHEFSHFSLWLEPVQMASTGFHIAEQPDTDWHTVAKAQALGLPQPIRQLIETYCE